MNHRYTVVVFASLALFACSQEEADSDFTADVPDMRVGLGDFMLDPAADASGGGDRHDIGADATAGDGAAGDTPDSVRGDPRVRSGATMPRPPGC